MFILQYYSSHLIFILWIRKFKKKKGRLKNCKTIKMTSQVHGFCVDISQFCLVRTLFHLTLIGTKHPSLLSRNPTAIPRDLNAPAHLILTCVTFPLPHCPLNKPRHFTQVCSINPKLYLLELVKAN